MLEYCPDKISLEFEICHVGSKTGHQVKSKKNLVCILEATYSVGYRNSPKYSDTLNFRTPLIFCKNNLFFVPNFGQLVKFLSLNFRTQNYDG